MSTLSREPMLAGKRAPATFRAFFPFYPYCNARTVEPLKMMGRVRIHTGELDD